MIRGQEHLSDEFEEWISTDDVAEKFGLTPASVRTNLPRRWGIRPVNDKWDPSDIELVRLHRKVGTKPKVA